MAKVRIIFYFPTYLRYINNKMRIIQGNLKNVYPYSGVLVNNTNYLGLLYEELPS
jgi:hypothetical protein